MAFARALLALFAVLAALVSACGGADLAGAGKKDAVDPSAGGKGGTIDDHPSLNGDDAGDDGKSDDEDEGKDEGKDAADGGDDKDDGDDDKVPPSTVLGPQPDDQTVGRCLANWGITEFSKQGLKYKIMSSNAFGPFANAPFIDAQPTKHKQIVLIKAQTFGPVSNIDMTLMNPKGFYCIENHSFSVINNVSIKRHCKATIGSDQTSTVSVSLTKSSQVIACDK